MATTFLTVVYAINDSDAFANKQQEIFDNTMITGKEPWSVSGFAKGDALAQLEQIEGALMESDLFAINEILTQAK